MNRLHLTRIREHEPRYPAFFQRAYTNLFLLGQVRMDDLESQLAVREPVKAPVVIEPEVTRMDDKVGARP